jgi:hypothetical protein
MGFPKAQGTPGPLARGLGNSLSPGFVDYSPAASATLPCIHSRYIESDVNLRA